MAVEQTIPGASPLIELSPLTDAELRSSGAVKLTHQELSELKTAYAATSAKLEVEKQRNEALNLRAISSETECRVLRDRLRLTGRREIIVRLIELVIIALVSFAIESAKSGDSAHVISFILVVIVLVVVIGLIQWWPHPPGETVNAEPGNARVR